MFYTCSQCGGNDVGNTNDGFYAVYWVLDERMDFVDFIVVFSDCRYSFTFKIHWKYIWEH